MHHSHLRRLARPLTATGLLALLGCNTGGGGDAQPDGRTTDGRTADGRVGDGRVTDGRVTDGRPPADARPPTDGTAAADATPADAAVAVACSEVLSLRCFTPAGSLPAGATSGVVVRALRFDGEAKILLQHRGNGTTEARGWSLCNGATCVDLPPMILESGRWMTVYVNAAGTDTDREVYLGPGALPLSPSGEVALYRTQDAGQRTPATLERFVAWGTPVPESRVADASAAGRWTQGTTSVCLGAVGVVVVGASDRPTGYRAQPGDPEDCAAAYQ